MMESLVHDGIAGIRSTFSLNVVLRITKVLRCAFLLVPLTILITVTPCHCILSDVGMRVDGHRLW
jgi:hypothetical protein